MFERRLKIFLTLLLVASSGLVLRAVQIQWVQHDLWTEAAKKTLRQSLRVDTTRGQILDRNNQVLALDEPCIDACVDYRVVTEEPDAKWIKEHADDDLRRQLGDQFAQTKRSRDWTLIESDEMARVRANLDAMWADLASLSHTPREDIEETRRTIVTGVETRRRYLWWRSYKSATTRPDHEDSKAWYSAFLGDTGDQDDVDKFELDIGEQYAPQVILSAVTPEVLRDLAPLVEKYPALSLRPGKHRKYPFGEIACHVVGWMGQVGQEEMKDNDPNAADDLRKYWNNEILGRAGVEAACEETLRGTKGRLEKDSGTDEIVASRDPIAGKDVHISVDVDMEKEILDAFKQRRTHTFTDGTVDTRWDQHGAAVVLDVKTGQVLAMVSNPGFDPNLLDKQFTTWAHNDLDTPMLNRATQMALEPGSTVKPIVGSGAITEGIMSPTDTIECTGYLVLRGHTYSIGRCWVAAQFSNILKSVAHHPVPIGYEHPTGFLTISDALERSCNVVFETIADRMGLSKLSFWFSQFGLGHPTGIGIEEKSGTIPPPFDASIHSPMRMKTWFAGIGQGLVQATPLQMANVAATVARGGIWLRPKLMLDSQDINRATTRPATLLGPDSVDLHLSSQAIATVQEGMFRVCNERAGTGTGIQPELQDEKLADDPLMHIEIAGKTGSAQTKLMTIPKRDKNGAQVIVDGRYQHDTIDLDAPGTEGWYHSIGPSKHMVHAWFIGYAPAKNPRVAFCVMVQYGETGGVVAGAIAHDVLEACYRHGYLGQPQ
ncbi:MAG: penicillin-binding transpeptidase domain-containing protein [Planctomycetota bacterium]|nr:penicillin-binding transpeptidase domain-containing protein [Planctomycetota bacterium]